MDTDGPGECVLEMLSDGECLRLMASVPIGRIVYTRRAMPAVEPVNFALDRGYIVIRTDPGGKLVAATSHAVVAFEADEFDFATHTGWSVTIVGTAQEVTDPAEIARLQDIGLASWAPGRRKHFVRIKPGIITGRRLRGAGFAHQQPKHASLSARAARRARRALARGACGARRALARGARRPAGPH